MCKTTTDPTSTNDVIHLDKAPYVIEGTANDLLAIYFESEQNKQEYLVSIASESDNSVINSYNEIQDNETMGTIN